MNNEPEGLEYFHVTLQKGARVVLHVMDADVSGFRMCSPFYVIRSLDCSDFQGPSVLLCV